MQQKLSEPEITMSKLFKVGNLGILLPWIEDENKKLMMPHLYRLHRHRYKIHLHHHQFKNGYNDDERANAPYDVDLYAEFILAYIRLAYISAGYNAQEFLNFQFGILDGERFKCSRSTSRERAILCEHIERILVYWEEGADGKLDYLGDEDPNYPEMFYPLHEFCSESVKELYNDLIDYHKAMSRSLLPDSSDRIILRECSAEDVLDQFEEIDVKILNKTTFLSYFDNGQIPRGEKIHFSGKLKDFCRVWGMLLEKKKVENQLKQIKHLLSEVFDQQKHSSDVNDNPEYKTLRPLTLESYCQAGGR